MTVQMDLFDLVRSDLDEIAEVILGHWCAPALIDASNAKARRDILERHFYEGGGGWARQGLMVTVGRRGISCRTGGVETLYRWPEIVRAVEAAATTERREAIRAEAERKRRDRDAVAEAVRLKASVYPDGSPVLWTSPFGELRPGWRCWHCGGVESSAWHLGVNHFLLGNEVCFGARDGRVAS